jgi:hypothetical protein
MKFESITVDVELDIDEILERVVEDYSLTDIISKADFSRADVCIHLKENYTDSEVYKKLAESMTAKDILDEIGLDKYDVVSYYTDDLDNEERAKIVGLDDDDLWELAVENQNTVQLLKDIDPELGEVKEYLNYGHTQEAIEEFFGTRDFGKMTAKEIWDQLVDSQEEEMIEIVTSKIGYVTLWESFSKEQRSELIKVIMKTYTLQSLVDILSEEPHLRDW